MEAFNELVRRIVKSFNAAGFDTCSRGLWWRVFYGVPRTTMDVDIVVEVSREGGKTFRDSRSPYSVDVIFSRKRLVKRAGIVAVLPAFYQVPEDLILAKLRMVKATVPRERALKDEEDVRAILRFTKVDVEAVKKQARRNNTLSTFLPLVTGH